MQDFEYQQQLDERQQFESLTLSPDQSLILELQTKVHYHQRMVEMLRQDLQRLRDGQDLDWEKWYDQP
jgi:predicted RNase H-like nuclease (RuvC/YqgF family)